MLAIVRDGSVEVKKQNKKMAVIQDGKAFIFDDRWITINADEEEGRKGQHVLIKENGDIIAGLGGHFKNLKDLGNNQGQTTIARDYNCDLAQKLGKAHYDAIRDKIENCGNEKFIKFWQKVESKVKVEDINYQKTACENRGKIKINLAESVANSLYKEPYESVIHESGHAVDFVAGKTYFSVQYQGGKFANTIISEVNEHVKRHYEIIKKIYDSHKDNRVWLLKHGYVVNGKFGYNKAMAYKAFEKEVNNYANLEGMTASLNINDILMGATRNKIGYGHKKNYWGKQDRYRGKNSGVALEAFAEMTASTAVNPKSLKVIKKFLPKSHAVYEEMIEVMSK